MNRISIPARIRIVLSLATLGAAQMALAQGGAPVLDPRDTQGYHEGSAQVTPGQAPNAQVWNPSSRRGEPIAVPRKSQRELQQYYDAQDAQRYRNNNRDRRQHRRD